MNDLNENIHVIHNCRGLYFIKTNIVGFISEIFRVSHLGNVCHILLAYKTWNFSKTELAFIHFRGFIHLTLEL